MLEKPEDREVVQEHALVMVQCISTCKYITFVPRGRQNTMLILAEVFYTLTVSVVAVLCRCHTSLRQPDTMRAHLTQKTLDIPQHDLSAKLLAGPPCCLLRYNFCLFQTFSPTAPSKRPVLSKGRTPTVFGARTTDTGGVSQSGRVHAWRTLKSFVRLRLASWSSFCDSTRLVVLTSLPTATHSRSKIKLQKIFMRAGEDIRLQRIIFPSYAWLKLTLECFLLWCDLWFCVGLTKCCTKNAKNVWHRTKNNI